MSIQANAVFVGARQAQADGSHASIRMVFAAVFTLKGCCSNPFRFEKLDPGQGFGQRNCYDVENIRANGFRVRSPGLS